MNVLLLRLLDGLVRTGTLKVVGPNGKEHEFGDGTGTAAQFHIKSRRAEIAITVDPMLALPEAYMNGDVDIYKGDVFGLMRLVFQNLRNAGIDTAWTKALDGLRHSFRRLQQINTSARARRNVERHYDLSTELYKLFLDEDMQYSCAYFESPDATLDEAQAAKKRHIAAKLAMGKGKRVLDIGCGWGGMGLFLAGTFDAEVLGVTLSTEQQAVAVKRARDRGLEQRAQFEVKDYRELNERFDRIVSVGMFEHVGINHYSTFFDKAAHLLEEDGVMLLHTIGRSGPPSFTNAFVRKYIFPGGYIPALSEIMPSIENAGLIVTDVEVLRLHYADTLRHWSARFAKNRERAKAIYDERFCRMWEFYLAASEASFRWQDLVVFQIQLTRRQDTLPITRNYMSDAEKILKLREPVRDGSGSG